MTETEQFGEANLHEPGTFFFANPRLARLIPVAYHKGVSAATLPLL